MSTLETFIAVNIAVIIAMVVVLWTVSTRQRLAALDYSIDKAMSLIETQTVCRRNALEALADLTAEYDRREGDALRRAIEFGCGAEYTAEHVMCREGAIVEALGRIAIVAEQYPELKECDSFVKSMEAAEVYENMARTSRLVYNDCVMKLNREIRMFPVSVVAGMLGYRQKAYLEEGQGG